MINTLFSNKIIDQFQIEDKDYVLPGELQKIIANQNHDLATFEEYRLQGVYQDEIWEKIKSLQLNIKWEESSVLDIASGGGLLSYHLLAKIKPAMLTLTDISNTAIQQSQNLLGKYYPNMNISYIEADILQSKIPDNSFDVIIGNSFVHHFYNVPEAFSEFNRLLKPGGVFISLHEPTISAVAVESGKFSMLALRLLRGKKYIDDVRKMKGDFPLTDNVGGDVWLFEENDVRRLLNDAGFDRIVISPWHLCRSFLVGLFGINLSPQKIRHNKFELGLLGFSISLDSLLRAVLPASLFGSVAICAYKKNNTFV